MKKYWFIFLTACSISTFCFNNVDAKVKVYDLANYPLLEFKDYFSEIKLKATTSESGKRIYATPEGLSYPSVTTVLSQHNQQAIVEWRNRVGQ